MMHTVNIPTKRPSRTALRAVALILCALMLTACSSVTGSSSPEDTALVNYFRDRLTETAAAPDGENVYWVRSGTVYHLMPDCRFLADAEDVICSSAAESGKSKACDACAEGATADAQSAGTDSAGTDSAETDSAETQTVPLETASPETSAVSPASTESAETAPVTAEPAPAETAAPQTPPPVQTESAEQTEAPVQTEAVNLQPETQADQTPIAGTVWWVKSGKVWHTTRDCPSLSRSKNIYSGTVEESGKERACKVCG